MRSIGDVCLTGVRHVEQSASRVTLNPHILRASEAGQRNQCTRLGDLRLVVVYGQAVSLIETCCTRDQLTMRREIGHAADRVALNLHVRTQHLSDQRFQSTQFDNEQLVVSYKCVQYSQNAALVRQGKCVYC